MPKAHQEWTVLPHLDLEKLENAARLARQMRSAEA